MDHLDTQRLSTIYKVQSGAAEYNDNWHDFKGFQEDVYGDAQYLLDKFATPKFYRNYENALAAVADAVVEKYTKHPTTKEYEDRAFTWVTLEDWMYDNRPAQKNLKKLHTYIRRLQEISKDSTSEKEISPLKQLLAQLAMTLNLVRIEIISPDIKFEDE